MNKLTPIRWLLVLTLGPVALPAQTTPHSGWGREPERIFGSSRAQPVVLMAGSSTSSDAAAKDRRHKNKHNDGNNNHNNNDDDDNSNTSNSSGAGSSDSNAPGNPGAGPSDTTAKPPWEDAGDVVLPDGYRPFVRRPANPENTQPDTTAPTDDATRQKPETKDPQKQPQEDWGKQPQQDWGNAQTSTPKKAVPVLRDQGASTASTSTALRDSTPEIPRFQRGSAKVFDRPLAAPFDSKRQPDAQLEGTVSLIGGKPHLKAGDVVKYADGKKETLGVELGSGAHADVYKATDKSGSRTVTKVIYLKYDRTAKMVMDHEAGRVILEAVRQDLPAGERGIFRVARQHGDTTLLSATDARGKVHKFAMSREDDISSPATTPGDASGGGDKDATRADSPPMVTNAYERTERGRKQLTEKEELTINLAIRHLNQRGIVWTDHKLANLDIVQSDESPTGYQVVFFDLDGFRPVNGSNESDRGKIARAVQTAYDSETKQGGDVFRQLSVVSKRFYGEENPSKVFDYTAFNNDVDLSSPSSEGANNKRSAYQQADRMSTQAFNAHVKSLFGGKVSSIPE